MDDLIYIVLVNYNERKYLKDCLESIFNQTYHNIKVVMIDNDSNDGSVEEVRKSFPDVEIFQTGSNTGFAHGCNVGIEYALENGTDYVMLLNIDTHIDTNLVFHLHRHAGSRKVTSPKIYSDQMHSNIWYAGGGMDYTAGSHTQFHDERLERKNSEPVHSMKFASGCCMLVHRDIWQKIGLLDEKYFMYFDDDDLSVRFRKSHIKMLYVPKAIMWHKVGGSYKGMKNILTEYYFTRNKLYFVWKHKDVMKIDIFHLTWQMLEQKVFHAKGNDKRYIPYVIRGICDFYLRKMYRSSCKF